MVPAIATPGRSGLSDKLVGSCPQITPATPFLAFVPACKFSPFRHPLSNLGALQELNLAKNQLSGSVPPELSQLTNLNLLYIDTNLLSGELPAELGELANLERVSVWGNELTWASHYENSYLGDQVALVAFYYDAKEHSSGCYGFCNWLTYNSLGDWEGVTVAGDRVIELNVVPSKGFVEVRISPELAPLTSLERLGLGDRDTRLIGKIPPELGSLTNLKVLDLRDGELSGTIPSELGNLAKLETLILTSNQLSGTIPPELGNLADLKTLYLALNQLSEELPTKLASLPELEEVSFWGNNLSWADDYESSLVGDLVVSHVWN